jgi:hypothetical protein
VVELENDKSEVIVNSHTFDCADYFCAVVMRKFEEVTPRITFPQAWRPSWVFTIGPQDPTEELERLCADIQDEIFWKQSVLIGYTIVREGEDDDSTDGETVDYSGL